MRYYFECGGCSEVHPLDTPVDEGIYSTLPERHCHRCGAEGCIDCVSPETGLCATCEAVAEG